MKIVKSDESVKSHRIESIPAAGQLSTLMRPSRFQETVRKWILLIPLSTAVAGSVAIRVLPTERFDDTLTPMFFIGALVVTIAMVHQRHMLNMNFALTDEVQVAHNRLDTLHHLSVELSTSLFVTQVAQIVLEHTMRLTKADRGAVWVLSDIAAPIELQRLWPEDKNEKPKKPLPVQPAPSSTPEATEWRIFAANGMNHLVGPAVLNAWKSHLQNKEFTPVREVPIEQSGIWVPIIWNGEVGAAIFIEGIQQPGTSDSGVLLEDIALIAGPPRPRHAARRGSARLAPGAAPPRPGRDPAAPRAAR